MFGTNAAIVDIVGHDKTGRAIASAKNNLKGLGRTSKAIMGSLGIGLGMAAVTRLTKEAIDYGSAMTDAALATRTGIEEYQVLKYAAQKAGASMQTVTLALSKTQKAANDAKNGLTTYTRAFDALGINVEKFRNLSPDRQMEELGRAMVNSKDQAVAYASVLDIIGSRNAPKLMEVLRDLGSEGFDAMATAAKNAGQIMSEETAQSLDAAADALARFQTQMTIATGEAIVFFEEVIKGEDGMRAAADAAADSHRKRLTPAMREALQAAEDLDHVIKNGYDSEVVEHYREQLDLKKQIVQEEQKQLNLAKQRAAEEEGILAHIKGLNDTPMAGKSPEDMAFDAMLAMTKRGGRSSSSTPAAAEKPDIHSILGLTGPSAYQSVGMPGARQSANPYSAKPGHVYSNFMAQKAQAGSSNTVRSALEKGGTELEKIVTHIENFVSRLSVAEQQIANAR